MCGAEMSMGSDIYFKTERRAFAVELRAVAKGRRLEGYAATFDNEARFAGFSETIKRGRISADTRQQGRRSRPGRS
jgi:hypothetical protein